MQNKDSFNLRVNDLLALPSMLNSVVVAGQSAIERIISAPNVIELEDLCNLSNKNEVVFCPGFLNSNQDKELYAYLNDVSGKISALCFKKGRFFRISQDILDLANKIGVVLIELPVEVVLTNIVREISEEILQRKASSFRNLQSKTEVLLDMLQTSHDLEETLTRIELNLENPIVLCTSDYDFIIAKKSEFRLTEDLKAEMMLIMKQENEKASEFRELECGNLRCHFLCISLTKHEKFAIFLFEVKKSIDYADSQAISRISRILAIELRNSSETIRIQNQYRDQFVKDLLIKNSGNTVDLCMLSLSYGLNLNPDERFVVVAVNIDSEKPAKEAESLNIKMMQQMIAGFSKSSLIHTVVSDRLVLIFRGQTLNDAIIKQELQQIQKKISPLIKNVKVFFCLSDEGNIAALPKLYQQACKVSQTYSISKPAINILTRQNSEPYYLFLAFKNNPDALDYCKKYIDPLRQYDEKFSSNLIETLRCFLSNLSIKDTAEHMHLHYNTISYRLNKIRSILELRLKDSLEIFMLQLALYIDEIRVIGRDSESNLSSKKTGESYSEGE
ncbi:MAG: PucR family transcriptional regulator [Anaerolineaceae bacterium]|nr:PucR family transcriptional regulator [Anaerolineaceae bacterium]